MLAHLFGTICLKHSATLILPPLLKPPSRRTCLIIISKLFSQPCLSPRPTRECVRARARVCVCVCVVSVIVKRPVLPLLDDVDPVNEYGLFQSTLQVHRTIGPIDQKGQAN